ncbi:MAG: aminotransferase class III-fold pyridoxal phosphate-dependent enzyme [Planctomycetaceae bacterium]|nr:aminotransferase class III-fold pyridoxal phosphate-dependent enzyme [Planctomycetaceae bacterium]
MSTNVQQARAALAKILREASGFDLEELNPSATFLELGFDSLFLIQFSQRIKSATGVKITFRQLIEEMPNIDSLLAYLEKNGKWAAAAPASVATSTTPTAVATAPLSPSPSPAVPEPRLAPTPSADVASATVRSSEPSAAPLPVPAVQDSIPESTATNIAPTSPSVTMTPALPNATMGMVTAPVMAAPVMTAVPPMALVSSQVAMTSSSTNGIEQIFSQQNQLMMMQLQMLRERRLGVGPQVVVAPAPIATPVNDSMLAANPIREAAPSSPTATIVTAPAPSPAPKVGSPATVTPMAAPTAAAVQAQKKVFERFGPYKPVRRSASGGLTEPQQKHLQEFVERFTQRTKKSRSHAQNHRSHFADPRGVAGYRRIWKSMVYQISVEKSAGSKLWDIDGNEYIDIAMGFGLNLFGQSPTFVTQALHAQLDRGVEVGPQSPLAGDVAKLLCEFSRMDRATFCNTGSEAVMAAMRIARTVTGKTKCVFFNKDYHGNFDQVLLRSATGGGSGSSPAAPGVPQFYADNTIVLEYGTEDSLRQIAEHADDIAAVLVEPVQSADPDLHPREFLHKLRQLTRERQIVMVMDEVISGFRAAPGGAQEYFDVWGDMATYGKILGGGLPIGALAGKAEYMDALDGGNWRYEDGSEPEADMTFFAGTFVRHPLAMAAAHQILTRIKAEGPALQQSLSRRTELMANEINEFFVSEGIPIRLARFTSLFRFIFPPDLEYADMLYFHLLDRGIFTRGWGDNCFLSTEHSDADVRKIIEAVKDSCLELRRAGFLPGREDSPNSPDPVGGRTHATELMTARESAVNTATTTAAPLPLKAFRASTVEEIQTEGHLPPLFCMPAADGLTLVYHELSDCLGPNQPVYGLNSPGVYGEPIPETIEEMAQRFIEDMQEVWPDGPYLLTGYCSGGTIALEVAQQLIAQGKQVAFLSGVETYNWWQAQSSQLTPWIKFVYQLQRFDFHFRNFWLLPGSDKWKFFQSKWQALKVRTRVWKGMFSLMFGRSNSHSTSGGINQAEIWKQHDDQADRYRPKPYPGKMHIFRPKKDYRSYRAKVDLVAEQGLEVVRLPVYPAGLMVRPYVADLAEMFAQGIREGLAEINWEPAQEQELSHVA